MRNHTTLVPPRFVTGDGVGLFSHAGIAWPAETADLAGLTDGLSTAVVAVPQRRRDPGYPLAQVILASPRLASPRLGWLAARRVCRTRRPIRRALATRSRFNVPHTFVFHPSFGYISSKGRCLRAAVWKTTSGRYVAKTSSIGGASRMSPKMTAGSSRSALPLIESCVECRPFSSRPRISNSDGSNFASCRQISLPIDPPAPVTSTLRPVMYPATSAVSMSAGLRPSRSAGSTGLVPLA